MRWDWKNTTRHKTNRKSKQLNKQMFYSKESGSAFSLVVITIMMMVIASKDSYFVEGKRLGGESEVVADRDTDPATQRRLIINDCPPNVPGCEGGGDAGGGGPGAGGPEPIATRCRHSSTYLSGLVLGCGPRGCAYSDFFQAIDECNHRGHNCGGFTQGEDLLYELRGGSSPISSPLGVKEISYTKSCFNPVDYTHYGKYIGGYPQSCLDNPGTCSLFYSSFIAAKGECTVRHDCGGITYSPTNQHYEIRASTSVSDSPLGETSWLKADFSNL